MDKKIFGIKISTYLSFILCLLCAFAVWLYVKIDSLEEAEDSSVSVEHSASYYELL